MMKPIHKKVKLQLRPVATEKITRVFDLTQEELDNKDGLLEYLNSYEAPRGYEVTDFTFLD